MKNDPNRKRILPPRLTRKVGRAKDHWGLRLDEFRVKYDLSVRDFVIVLDGTLRKSAVHDLCSGESLPRMEAVIKPVIAGKLRAFLAAKGRSEFEIEQEMMAIFYEPVCKKEEEPMITKRRELSSEAQRHFALSRDPFDPLEPRSIDDLFTTSSLDRVARQVEDAIKRQQFIAIIGGIGSGKTTLVKRTVETVNRSNGKLRLFFPAFFNMDRVNSGSIVYWLLHQFEQRAPADLLSRASALKNVLAKLSDDGVRVALGFDECHRLDNRLIIALKNFWELGNGGFDRYLGVVLFGQTSFDYILAKHREIAERCEVINMPTLVKAAATDYLEHRVALSGGKLDRLFEPAAVKRMLALADTPLALGNVANAGLMKAFQFAEKRVVADHIPETGGDPQVRATRPTTR